MNTTGLTRGTTPHEFTVGEFVVLSEGTTSHRFGDRDGRVTEIRRSGVVVDLDRGRDKAGRTRLFRPEELYHINVGWHGGTYESPARPAVSQEGPASLSSLLRF
jgi:hypothetical protein